MSESAVSNGNGGGTSGSNGYYLMRRHSRGPSGSPRPSNSTIPPSPTLSSSAAATVSIPSPQDQTINLPDFSNKSKEELIRLHSKLHAELNIKNKIIYDLRARENWVSAELMAAKKTAPPKPQNVSDDFGNGLPEGLSLDSPDFEDAKAKLFQTILQFKKELSKAKQSVEQNANLLRESEKRREAAQDEVNHLQSVIQSLNSGSGKVTELGNQRIQKLESALQTAQNEISSLQSKVSLWARASKKNQEARIQAEACQRTVENEANALRSLLSQTKESEEKYRKKAQALEGEVNEIRVSSDAPRSVGPSVASLEAKIRELEARIREKDEKLNGSESVLEAARLRIAEFEQTMQDAYTTVDELERENSSLRTEVRTRDARISEITGSLDRLQSVAESGTKELAQSLQEAESKINAVSAERDRLRSELRDVMTARDRLQMQVEEAESEVETMRKSLQDAHESGDRHANDLSQRFKNLEEMHLNDVASLQRRLEEVESARNMLQRDFDESIQVCTALQTEIGTLRSQRVQMDATAAQYEILSREAQEKNAECDELKVLVDKLRREHENATAELSSVAAKSREVHNLRAQSTQELDSLKQELLLSQQEVRRLTELLAESNGRIEELEAESAMLESEHKDSNTLIADLRAELSDVTEQINSLEAENTELLTQLNQLESDLAKERALHLAGLSESEEAMRIRYEGQIKQLNAQIYEAAHKARELENMNAERLSIEQDLEVELAKVARLESAIVEERHRCDDAEAKLVEYEENVVRLNQTIIALQEELSDEKAKFEELRSSVHSEIKSRDVAAMQVRNYEMDVRSLHDELERSSALVTSLYKLIDSFDVSERKLRNTVQLLESELAFKTALVSSSARNAESQRFMLANAERAVLDERSTAETLRRMIESYEVSERELRSAAQILASELAFKTSLVVSTSMAMITMKSGMEDLQAQSHLGREVLDSHKTLKAESEGLQEKVDQLTEELRSASLAVVELRALAESNHSREARLNRTVQEQESALAFKSSLVRSSADCLSTMRKSVERLEEELRVTSSMAGTTSELQEAYSDLNSKLVEMSESVSKNIATIGQLRALIDGYESSERSLKGSIQLLSSELAFKQALVNSSGSSLSMLSATVAKLEQELDDCNTEITEMQSDYESTITRLQEQVNATVHSRGVEDSQTAAALQGLKDELQEASNRRQRLEATLQDAEETIQTLRDELRRNSSTQAAVISENTDAKQQIKDLQTEIRALEKRHADALDKIEALTETANSRTANLSRERDEEVAKLKAEVKRFEGLLEAKEEEEKEWESRVQELEELQKELEDELQATAKAADDALQQVDELSAKLEATKAAGGVEDASSAGELQALRKRVEELQRTNNYLLAQLQRAEEQINAMEMERDRGGPSVADSVQESLSFQVKAAFQQVALISEEKDAIAKENATLHRKVAQLLQKLQEVDDCFHTCKFPRYRKTQLYSCYLHF